MNLILDDVKEGDKVKFCESNPLTFGVSSDNAKLLKVHDVYTVDRIEIHSWHTKVFLKEFPGIEFNSVWFIKGD